MVTVIGEEMASLTEDFFGKNTALVSDLARKNGLEKLCQLFEGKCEMLTFASQFWQNQRKRPKTEDRRFVVMRLLTKCTCKMLNIECQTIQLQSQIS